MPIVRTANFPVAVYGDAAPIPGRDGCWLVVGPRPMFEVLADPKGLPDVWTMVSFSVSVEGSRRPRCFILVRVGPNTQRFDLGSNDSFSVVLRLSPHIGPIRILLMTDSRIVAISPVAVRSLGKVEAGLRLASDLIRLNGYHQVAAKIKRAVRVLRNGGWGALGRWFIEQRMLDQDIEDPWLVPTTLDLFDDVDVANATGLGRSEFLWVPQPGNEIGDLWAAVRYCLDLLRGQADLRGRFPDALSAGSRSAFAEWLTTNGGVSLGLSLTARDRIRQAFDAGLSDRIRQIYLTHEDLRDRFPLALTPAGRRDFFRWLLRDGRTLPGVRLETIWWFFIECAENPAAELVRTFLFTPSWQSHFPDGVTVFGRAKFAAWLVEHFGLDASWVCPLGWPLVGTPAENIRLAYSIRDDWQGNHPQAFDSEKSADRFLHWLVSPAAALSSEASAWCNDLDRQKVIEQLVAGGVNILGHFCYPSGLRTSVESISESIRRAGLGCSLRDIPEGFGDDPQHATYNGLEYYEATIIHTQPEPFFDLVYPRSGLQPRNPRPYRIGYWYWELDRVPQSWATQVAQVNELWVATKFVADALRRTFDVPVFQMMPGLELPEYPVRRRSDFGLPEDKFTFLFVFHTMSIMERKNPVALIKAYRKAFGDDNRVMLILKTSFGEKHRDQMEVLYAAAAGGGITIIDAIYTQEETLSLMATADCYVSLHRSEGWGLTMAEAMLLGKPVIATGYSGNMDFMESSNSMLVNYQLVTLDRNYPPYAAGLHWADPSVDHAARLMRQVYENQAWARILGATAQADLRDRMSLAASGRRMTARLGEIKADGRFRALEHHKRHGTIDD